ncbi:MAG TPA: DUF1592 domain-containing protein [Tepidisphaeraceae bacterium]|nr:DUF1592 domain-containing protein [Tepidisphaeraceae bacterium]
MRFASTLRLLLIPVVGALATGVGSGAPPAAPAVPPGGGDFAQVARTVLQQFCIECHGPDKQKARLRYDQLAGYRIEDRNLWAKMHEQISSGEMPPADHAPQPTAHQRQALLAWIERSAADARTAAGAGGTRRLNRRELSAALQDVTGLSVDYALSIPGDGKVGGFDTGADALQDAADSVTTVMKITRRAVDGIRFLEPAPAQPVVFKASETDNPRKHFEVLFDPAGKRPGKPKPGKELPGMMIPASWLGDREGAETHFPIPADGGAVARIKLRVAAVKPFPNLPSPRLWVEVGGQDFDYHEVTGTLEKPEELVYEVQLDELPAGRRGIQLSLKSRVEVPYAVEGFENDEPEVKPDRPQDFVPGGVGLYRPRYDRKLPQEKRPVPFAMVLDAELVADHVAQWPPASWNANLGTIGDDAESARKLIALWAERAWRRPVAPAELERFDALYAKLRADGMTFDNALRAAFQSVLMSAGFRYLPAAGDPAAGQHAVASRLSFMLVGAPPDAELRRLAAAGKLRDPAVLDAQVDRLLAGPRAVEGFVRPFVMQWLEMDQPITLVMDHIRKQDFRFGRHLKASMKDETVRYVGALIAENRPAAELVASDWTLMNDILARHYGYPAMAGGTLRKVVLRKDDPRGGGILGHAGIQSMLCWMGENWVIYRGAWALRHVLDEPPPPPPLEVPELVPSDGKNAGKSFRELLVQHQADANCSTCHRKMDPLGFAFQNFDLSGRWRDVEHEKYTRNELDGKIEWKGAGKTRPVDAAGKLPRGEAFTTWAECRQLIARNYQDDVVRGLLKSWVIYGTGRLPDVDDLAGIRRLMAEQKAGGYKARDLLKGLVRSKMFLGGA